MRIFKEIQRRKIKRHKTEQGESLIDNPQPENMHNFKELKVWQKAIEFTVEIYKLTASFPSEERFGLISRLRRASVSTSSNIAEGSGRNSDKDFVRFLSISIGSAYETETQLIISRRLNYVDHTKFEELATKITEIQRMLNAFSENLKNKYLKN